jgi:hypothetical protein
MPPNTEPLQITQERGRPSGILFQCSYSVGLRCVRLSRLVPDSHRQSVTCVTLRRLSTRLRLTGQIVAAHLLGRGPVPFVRLRRYEGALRCKRRSDGYITLTKAMKRNAVLLFLLFAAILGFGRTPSQQDTAQAVKGVLRLRDGMRSPDNFQVSRVLITDKGVCIDYRSKNESGAMSTGFAVYKANKDTLWVDNSWVWEEACLFGKLAQRRDGTDITEAARAALKGQQAARVQAVSPAVPVAAAPAAQPVALAPPVGVPGTPSQTTVAVTPPSSVVPASAARDEDTVKGAPAQAVSPAVPVATAPAAQPVVIAPPVVIQVTPAQTTVAVTPPIPVVPAPAAQPGVDTVHVAAPVPVQAPMTPPAPAPVATHPAAQPATSIQVVTIVPAVTQSTERPATPAVVTSAPVSQRAVAAVTVTPAGATHQSAPPSAAPAASGEPPRAPPTPVVPAAVSPAVAAAPVAAPVPVQAPVTPPAPAPVATHPAAQPVVSTHVVTVVPTSPVTQSTERPVAPAAVTSAPAAQKPVAMVPVTPVAANPSATPSTATREPSTIHGVVILDSQGALGKPTPSIPAPPQESLADAARRVKKAKQPEP